MVLPSRRSPGVADALEFANQAVLALRSRGGTFASARAPARAGKLFLDDGVCTAASQLKRKGCDEPRAARQVAG